MQNRHVRHPFAAVVDGKCKTLILGSVPSVKSVENSFYYMHPKNRFWRVLSALLGTDLYSADIETRKRTLLAHGIALYDSVEECDIAGSSDSKISGVIPADIPGLIEGTEIMRIFCNGAASYTLLLKYHPQLEPMTVKLPSTSPANASCSLEELIETWKIIVQ